MEKNVISVNPLPVRTWDHLNMNESTVKNVCVRGAGKIDANVRERVLLCDEKEKYLRMDGGAGRDLKNVLDDAKIPWQGYETDGIKIPLRLNVSCEDGCAFANRVGLTVKENQNLDVIMDFSSGKDDDGFYALSLRADVEDGARLRLIQIIRPGQKFTFADDLAADCGRNARFEVIWLVLSGHRIYEGCRVRLKGDGSRFEADAGYRVFGNDLLDMNEEAVHLGKNTGSLICASGSLSGRARKLFRGTIDFKKGASGSCGNEKEDVLLADEMVVNQTIPLILCAEEDVCGNHGATIGKPDENIIFYMTSRGMSRDRAVEILKAAGLMRAAGKIWDDSLRQELTGLLDEGE